MLVLGLGKALGVVHVELKKEGERERMEGERINGVRGVSESIKTLSGAWGR